MSKLNSSLYDAPVDQLGRKIQFDVREDEEQNKKLQETLELLVAAGYFRARIKGLSAFDKIVGGLTWCITTCNFDVDVDLLFQESSTIGQKIALTERIVAVLPRMKCPHAIEPHQIQGLDFIHIYPVVQFLVKKAIETRQEMGDQNRNFALSQFKKLDMLEDESKPELKSIKYLNDANAPQRKYVRRNVQKIKDKYIRVQSTLLEYGLKVYLTRPSAEVIDANLKNTPLNLKQDQEKQQNELIQAEDENLKRLMSDMSETGQKAGKLSANALEQILGIQQNEMQKMATQFADQENDLKQELENLDKLGELPGGGYAHKMRFINMLRKQIEQKELETQDKKQNIDKLEKQVEELKEKLNNLKEISSKKQTEIDELDEYTKNADKSSIDKLEELIAVRDSLKAKELDYKKGCKEELEKLQNEIEELKQYENDAQSEDNQKYNDIVEQYDSLKQKIQSVRLKIAKKNREISLLERKIDEIPSRAELSQYQKRFVELYNQISTVHTQTKQFYILYNALEDKKVYMTKEINLLNSIHDQYSQAMASSNTREQFLKQLDTILDGLKVNYNKNLSKKTDEKAKRDALNDKLIDLMEKKRVYYKTLKDFQEECKKNGLLLAKVQGN